jgi:PEGA domain
VVNGVRRGVTPLALRDLAAGTYAVRVSRSGYRTAETRVAIDGRRPARSVDLTLVRAVPSEASSPARTVDTGSLVVESRPAGARVVLDGAPAGMTPLTIPTLGTGAHTVRIELGGYQPITTTASVEARVRARVAVTLTPERPR